MSNLQYIRNKRGMSQSQLARVSGVSLRTIQHYESGYRNFGSAAVLTVLKIAKALQCSVEDFFS